MSTVVDYTSNPFGNAAGIKAAGHTGVMRYLGGSRSKDLSPAERDDLRANGLSIGLVYEAAANRAGQGFQAGHDDAVAANAQADALGYPKACTLWYAVDFDATPAQVQPYFDGVASAGGRTHAPYGSEKIISGVRYPGFGWQTVAWSHGAISSRAGLLQNGFHGNHDSNVERVADYGQWQPAAVVTETTTSPIVLQEDDDMASKIWKPVGDGHPNVGGEFVQEGHLFVALSQDTKQQLANSETGGDPSKLHVQDVEPELWHAITNGYKNVVDGV